MTQSKNFNLLGLSVVVKYNTNKVDLIYPAAMKILSEKKLIHRTEEQNAAAGEDFT